MRDMRSERHKTMRNYICKGQTFYLMKSLPQKKKSVIIFTLQNVFKMSATLSHAIIGYEHVIAIVSPFEFHRRNSQTGLEEADSE